MFNRKKEKAMKARTENQARGGQTRPANRAILNRNKTAYDEEPDMFDNEDLNASMENVGNMSTEPSRLFGNEESVNNDATTLYDYLFNCENILNIYDSVLTQGLDSDIYLDLVDAVNEEIRTGNILDDSINTRVTPSTLESIFFKVVCAVMDDERRIEVEDLTDERDNLKKELESAVKEINNGEDLSELKDTITELEDKYNKLRTRYNAMVEENDQLNCKIVEFEGKLSVASSHEDEMQVEHLNSVIEKLKAAKDRVENDKLELELKLDTLAKEFEEATRDLEELKEENANLNLKIEELTEETLAKGNVDEDFELRIKELADKLGEKEIELIEANNTIRTLESEVNKKKRELLMIPDSSLVIKKLEEALDMVSKENRELVEENINLISANKQLESKITQTETVNQNLEVLIAGYKRRLDSGERLVIDTVEETKEEPVVLETVADVNTYVEEKEITEEPLVEEIEELEEIKTYTDLDLFRMFILGMEYRVLAQKLKPEFKTKHSEVGQLIIDNLDKVSEYKSDKEFIVDLIKERFIDGVITNK